MKIYRVSNKKMGGDIVVRGTDFWSSESKLVEVYDDILNGRLSFSTGVYPIVTKSLDIPRAAFIMDGHHRVIEGLLNGQTIFDVTWNEHFLYMDSGIGNELPLDKIRVVDFLSKQPKEPSKEPYDILPI